MPKIKKITLGYSVLSDYNQCETKFKYRHLDKLTKPHTPDLNQGSPLSFGTYVHEFMEFYHRGIPINEVLDQVLGKASLSALVNVGPDKKRSLLHLELLLRNYVKVFPDPFADFKPYDIEGRSGLEYETSFVISTEPLIVWRQRYDGIITLPDGKVACLEHKTSSGDLRKDLRARMLPNDQAVGYIYGMRRALGIPAAGVLFNGLCTYRPLVNPDYVYRGRGEPQPLFLREFVPIEDWMLDEWLTKTVRKVKRMLEDIEDNVFSDDAPNSCSIFNGRCQFAELCKTAPKLRQNFADFAYEKEIYEGFKIEYE